MLVSVFLAVCSPTRCTAFRRMHNDRMSLDQWLFRRPTCRNAVQ